MKFKNFNFEKGFFIGLFFMWAIPKQQFTWLAIQYYEIMENDDIN